VSSSLTYSTNWKYRIANGSVEQLVGSLDCKSSSFIRHVGSSPTSPTEFHF